MNGNECKYKCKYKYKCVGIQRIQSILRTIIVLRISFKDFIKVKKELSPEVGLPGRF